jgi:hypothetical protein
MRYWYDKLLYTEYKDYRNELKQIEAMDSFKTQFKTKKTTTTTTTTTTTMKTTKAKAKERR